MNSIKSMKVVKKKTTNATKKSKLEITSVHAPGLIAWLQKLMK
jgi:hypothetical protein